MFIRKEATQGAKMNFQRRGDGSGRKTGFWLGMTGNLILQRIIILLSK